MVFYIIFSPSHAFSFDGINKSLMFFGRRCATVNLFVSRRSRYICAHVLMCVSCVFVSTHVSLVVVWTKENSLMV